MYFDLIYRVFTRFFTGSILFLYSESIYQSFALMASVSFS